MMPCYNSDTDAVSRQRILDGIRRGLVPALAVTPEMVRFLLELNGWLALAAD